jgi:hypothetical protein
MRPVTRILYSLCDRLAVRRAERAKRNWQPAKGIRRDIKGRSPLAGFQPVRLEARSAFASQVSFHQIFTRLSGARNILSLSFTSNAR